MMKKSVALLLVLCLPWAAEAQENTGSAKDRAVYMEVGGGSTGVGISYDERFNPHTRWGWRGGVGWAYTKDEDFLGHYSSTRAWAVPLEVNYLIGNRRNSLELGFGVNLGVYNGHWTTFTGHSQEISMEEYERYMEHPDLLPANSTLELAEGTGQATLRHYEANGHSENVFGYYFFGDIGWRHTSRGGFILRMGISPSFNFGGSHAVSKSVFYPYISIGWVFGRHDKTVRGKRLSVRKRPHAVSLTTS